MYVITNLSTTKRCPEPAEWTLKLQGSPRTIYVDILKIYRNQTLIFEYGNEDLAIEGFLFQFFVDLELSDGHFCQHILHLHDTPYPCKFLIIQTGKDKTHCSFTTPSSADEIFNDINFDVKIEIGG